MRALLVVLILSSAVAVAKKPRGFTAHQAKAQDTLLKRCNAGVGKACFDYGHNLELFLGKTTRRERITYVRRACELAYQKACSEVSPPQKLKLRQASRPKSKVKPGVDTLSR